MNPDSDPITQYTEVHDVTRSLDLVSHIHTNFVLGSRDLYTQCNYTSEPGRIRYLPKLAAVAQPECYEPTPGFPELIQHTLSMARCTGVFDQDGKDYSSDMRPFTEKVLYRDKCSGETFGPAAQMVTPEQAMAMIGNESEVLCMTSDGHRAAETYKPTPQGNEVPPCPSHSLLSVMRSFSTQTKVMSTVQPYMVLDGIALNVSYPVTLSPGYHEVR